MGSNRGRGLRGVWLLVGAVSALLGLFYLAVGLDDADKYASVFASLGTVAGLVLLGQGVHQPRPDTLGDSGTPDHGAPVPSPRPPARRWLTAVAVVLAFVVGLSVSAGPEWWRRRTPQAATGPCSPRATLLSHSDRLDKATITGEPISDLSALALTGPSRAFALTDKEPARIFPMGLGPADRLAPRVDTARTLRHADGSKYSSGIDGEGLVVEKGANTILVASEEGPSIRRFRLSDGREQGKPLPIPRRLRTRPAGDAQAGRTIEALAATPDGRYLFAGMESPLSTDGDNAGRNLIRIQRYKGTPGGTYTPDRQFGYETGEGLHLTELAAIGEERLIALERQFVTGMGNAVRVYEISLEGVSDVTEDDSIYPETSPNRAADDLARKGPEPLLDLADCPAGSPGQVMVRGKQPNPLLGNVEGMALGDPITAGKHKGWRQLYLVSDDNNRNPIQITRLYAFAVRVP
jgi:hypothetical protein